MGDACVHDKQALVLVNRSAASGEAVLTLANTIAADVQNRFGVTLEYEPWVW
jgi:UDP-N-acetylmuramate dehydrogenase